jgi:uncharacterized membrane protein
MMEPKEPIVGEEQRLDSHVGGVLLVGLLLSITVMTLGLVVTAVRGGDTTHVLPLDRVIPELAKGHTAAILDLGILMLFATPLLGIVVAFEGFWEQGDRDFVLVTAILLVMLAAALAIALH